MICADLEGLVSAHDQTSLSVLAVLEQADVAGTTLLPLAALTDKLEKLSSHLKKLLLQLLVRLDLDLLRQPDDRLEVDVFGFGCLLILSCRRLVLARV